MPIEGFLTPILVDGCHTKLSSVRDHIVPRNEVVYFMRKILCDHGTISIFVLILFAEALLNQTSLLNILPLPIGWVFLAALGATTWVIFYYTFGHVIWLVARHNIPVAITGMFFCLFISSLFSIIFIVIWGHLLTLDHIFSELFKAAILMKLGMFGLVRV